MFALHSSMSPLDYMMNLYFDYPDDDASSIAFIHAASSIGGRDAVKEYLACGMLPLLANFGFGKIVDGETPISKVVVLLPDFPFARVARVELEALNIVREYRRGVQPARA
jgi:hypothetical protein